MLLALRLTLMRSEHVCVGRKRRYCSTVVNSSHLCGAQPSVQVECHTGVSCQVHRRRDYGG